MLKLGENFDFPCNSYFWDTFITQIKYRYFRFLMNTACLFMHCMFNGNTLTSTGHLQTLHAVSCFLVLPPPPSFLCLPKLCLWSCWVLCGAAQRAAVARKRLWQVCLFFFAYFFPPFPSPQLFLSVPLTVQQVGFVATEAEELAVQCRFRNVGRRD